MATTPGQRVPFHRLTGLTPVGAPDAAQAERLPEEMKLVSPDRCLGISLWKDRESATRYHDSTYPKVLEKLQPVIEGKPRVENYEVTPSTVTA